MNQKQMFKRVLIIKLWALGDILMATPVLSALRQYQPEVHITWVVDSAHAAILSGHPLVDEVISLDTRAWRRLLRKGNVLGWLRYGAALNRRFRQRKFDAVINYHPEKWWTRWLCAAPVRVGLYPSAALPLSRVVYTKVIPKPSHPQHNTDYYLEGVKALGLPGPFDRRMKYQILPGASAEAAAFLAASAGYDLSLPLIVLHPGTSQESKSWLPENFAAVAAALSPRFNVVLTGSAKEAALAEKICALLPPGTRPPVVAAGHFKDIRVLAALIGQAAAVVTGDTVALHLASALETPVVGIYGGSRPGDNAPLFGPQVLLHDDAVPCAPCYKERCPLRGADHLRCQRAVTPAHVLNALERLAKQEGTRQ